MDSLARQQDESRLEAPLYGARASRAGRTTRVGAGRVGLTGEDILSVSDAAAFLGIPVRTAYRLAGRNELPGARRLGRAVIVVRPVLEQWLLTDVRGGQ